MNKIKNLSIALLIVCAFTFVFNENVQAQGASASGREEYTGNAISFNGPRTATAFFTLRINGTTSDEQASQYLSTLQNQGQQAAFDAIQNQNLGNFSINNRIGPPINVVRETQTDGGRRIFIVFARWLGFGELRGGYRSVDYPFSVIELFIDERTGRGSGTYIPAARIRLEQDRGTNQRQLEIENFAIYPVKLNNVRRVGNRRQ